MLKYIAKKLFYGVVVLIMVVNLIISLLYLAPVDAATLTFGQRSDTKTLNAKREELGLNGSLSTQLINYWNDLLPFSFHENTPENTEKYNYTVLYQAEKTAFVYKSPYLRQSYQSGKRVDELLWEAVPKTVVLALLSMFIALIIGIGLGIIAALHQNKWIDRTILLGATLFVSLPSYVVAILLAYIFAYQLHDYTGLSLRGGLYDWDNNGNAIIAYQNLILPTCALAIRPIALITQLTRSSFLEVIHADYIRTAKAKGLSPYIVWVKHALQNALQPIITASTGWLAGLLTGAFFVETIFNYNGLGELTINALLQYDLPIVVGSVLFTASIFVFLNIITDILYAYFDPRVRLS